MYPQLFPRALGSWILTASLLVSSAPTHAGSERKESLTLARALALALAKSPDLAASTAEHRAREAHALQAGLLPNPQLRAEVENVGGSGDRQGLEETETTVGLSQLLEIAGKRGKRQRVARLEAALAGFDHEARTLAVLSATTKAFVRALAARQRLRLATELEQLATSGVGAMRAQVAAGAAPAVEVTRARVTLGKSAIVRRRAEHDLEAAEAGLAAMWGSDRLAPFELEGDLTPAGSLPAVGAVEAGVTDGPELTRWGTELDERRAAVAMEEAARIPDITVGAAGRHFSDNGDDALVFDLSVPLPVFNRNQGAIAEAHHRLDKARAEREAAVASVRVAVAATHAELVAAHEQATRLREEVIPDAQRAFDGARAAYRQGAFRSVDVLDAQRTLFDLRAEYVDALETFHVQAAELDRLTGRFPTMPDAAEDGR